MDGADLSSNGAYVSVMALRVCEGYTSGLCRYADESTLYDSNGQVALTADGRVRLSANGKWALGVANQLTGGTNFTLYDLVNGTSYPMTNMLMFNLDWRLDDIADDGTAVIANGSSLMILRAPASIQTLYVDVQSVVIDAAGKTIVWESGGLHLVRTDDLGNSVTIGVPADYQPRISDDGSRILFLSPIADIPQVFVMNTDGSGRRAVTAEPDGIAEAVLSGDGQVAWALTRTGRLVKFDIGSGAGTQYTEPLAAFLRDQYVLGGQLRPYISGTPGSTFSAPASVMPGENVEITIGDQIAPVLSLEPQTVVFQIPSTLPPPSSGTVNYWVVGIRKPDSSTWSGNTLELYLAPTNH